jgi:hypothetical protein
LIAIDRTDKKTDLVRQTCSTFGADCSVFTFDSTKACSELEPLSKSLLDGPPFHPESFDKVPNTFLPLRFFLFFPADSSRCSMQRPRAKTTVVESNHRKAIKIKFPSAEKTLPFSKLISLKNHHVLFLVPYCRLLNY